MWSVTSERQILSSQAVSWGHNGDVCVNQNLIRKQVITEVENVRTYRYFEYVEVYVGK